MSRVARPIGTPNLRTWAPAAIGVERHLVRHRDLVAGHERADLRAGRDLADRDRDVVLGGELQERAQHQAGTTPGTPVASIICRQRSR